MSTSGSAAIAFVALLACCTASPANAQTLEDALASAYRVNPKLLAQRDQLKTVDEGVAQAHANWRPTISIQASDSYVNEHISGSANLAAEASLRTVYPGDSYGLTVTQPLYRGGRSLAELRRARAAAKGGEAGLLAVEEEVMLTVVGDYLDAVRDQELAALASQREEDARRQSDGAQAKFKGGEATRLDTASAASALTDAKIAHLQAAAQFSISSLTLARDTGLKVTHLAPVTSIISVPETAETASSLATSQSFDVKVAQYNVTEAEEQLASAKGQGRPTISLQGTLLHQDGISVYNGSERVAAAAIQLKVPIYSGGMLSSQIREAQAALDEKRHLLDEALQTAQAEAAATFIQSSTASAVEAQLQQKVAETVLQLAGVTRQQQAGERGIADVISTEQTLFSVRVAAIQSFRDAQMARFSLANSVGQLTAEHLDLPVDLYDPERYLRKIAWGPGR